MNRSAPHYLLRELHYGQVQLADGPLKRQVLENHQLLLDLNEESLLRPFRVRAHLAAPGNDLGGWYDADAFAPGATFGQWLSALSRFARISGDQPSQAKAHRLVRGYAATIDARFYANNRFPAYTYDKLVGGLLDARYRARDPAALDALRSTTQTALPYLPSHAVPRNEHSRPYEDFTAHAWDESYTLPENQFLAWKLTGNERHLLLAKRFMYHEFFSALAAGEDVLPGKHAYSHVNALSSAAQAYLSLGTSGYLQAAERGFGFIDAQSFATGGWGPDEHFVEPASGALGASLEGQKMSFETPCGAYAHFKLTRYLLRITRDARYGDSMERILYNASLGALPIQPDGRAFYYSDYTQHAQKTFHWDRWPCCSGTLPLLAADYPISVCFVDAQGIFINLYVPASVVWEQGGVRCGLKMVTRYPYDDVILLELALPTTLRFSLHLRIPHWAPEAQVHINGQRQPSVWPAGTFAELTRDWSSGDRVELVLALPLRLLSVDAHHPDTVALVQGPLVLMRVLDGSGREAAALTRRNLLSAERKSSGATDWQLNAQAGTVTLRSFMDIGQENYRVYQYVQPGGR
ncbi:MAG: beta-L-arabinofuranosidase domain-containing protein [Steroidobacteraceae bacterium]|jgi:DUF1680 family protein